MRRPSRTPIKACIKYHQLVVGNNPNNRSFKSYLKLVVKKKKNSGRFLIYIDVDNAPTMIKREKKNAKSQVTARHKPMKTISVIGE